MILGVNVVKVAEVASKPRVEVRSRKHKTSELIVQDLILHIPVVISIHVQVSLKSSHFNLMKMKLWFG